MLRLAAFVAILFITILSSFVLIGFMQPQFTIYYNGQQIYFSGSKPDLIDDGINSTIIVPVDSLALQMGVSAAINADAKVAVVKNDADTITFCEGKKTAAVNGSDRMMPVKAVYIKNHVYVPVRFLAQTLGKTVFWDDKTNTVNIYDPPGTNPDPR